MLAALAHKLATVQLTVDPAGVVLVRVRVRARVRGSLVRVRVRERVRVRSRVRVRVSLRVVLANRRQLQHAIEDVALSAPVGPHHPAKVLAHESALPLDLCGAHRTQRRQHTRPVILLQVRVGVGVGVRVRVRVRVIAPSSACRSTVGWDGRMVGW